MTHDARMKLLTEWYEKGLALEEANDTFMSLLGIDDTDCCPILKAAWNIWEAYTESVSARVGDASDWLYWWWWDAEHGTGTCDVTAAAAWWKGKARPIRTVAALCKLIEADIEE